MLSAHSNCNDPVVVHLMESFDAIVVGAGLAGITCANALAVGGLNVCLLEARSRTGGRLSTSTLHACDGEEHVVCTGPAWIHGMDAANPVAAALLRSGASRSASRLVRGDDTRSKNPWLRPDVDICSFLDMSSRCLVPDAACAAAVAAYHRHAAAATTLDDATPLSACMLTWGVDELEAAVWRAHLAWFGTSAERHTAADVALDDAGDFQGDHALLLPPVDALTTLHPSVQLRLNQRVVDVRLHAPGVARVSTDNGHHVLARHVCVCIPAPLLLRAPWRAVLTSNLRDADERIAALSSLSTCAYTRTYVILHAGIHAQALTSTRPLSVPVYGVQPPVAVSVVENHTALHSNDDASWPGSSPGVHRSHVCLCACVVQSHDDSSAACSDTVMETAVKDAVTAYVAAHTNGSHVCAAECDDSCSDGVRIEAMHAVRWHDDPLAAGAYPCMSGVPDAYERVRTYARPGAMSAGSDGPVMYFASDACDAAYMGSMHGAMRAGLKAARQVLKAQAGGPA